MPASAHTQYASQGSPITSDWTASASTAANAAAIPAAAHQPVRRAVAASPVSSARPHAVQRSKPSSPVSAPNSV